MVDYTLRGVGKVAKLRLPNDERVRIDLRIAELKAEHRILAQRRVAAEMLDRRLQAAARLYEHRVFGLRVGKIVERIVRFLVDFLIVKNMVTMRERAALDVLAADANVDACSESAVQQKKKKISLSNFSPSLTNVPYARASAIDQSRLFSANI